MLRAHEATRDVHRRGGCAEGRGQPNHAAGVQHGGGQPAHVQHPGSFAQHVAGRNPPPGREEAPSSPRRRTRPRMRTQESVGSMCKSKELTSFALHRSIVRSTSMGIAGLHANVPKQRAHSILPCTVAWVGARAVSREHGHRMLAGAHARAAILQQLALRRSIGRSTQTSPFRACGEDAACRQKTCGRSGAREARRHPDCEGPGNVSRSISRQHRCGARPQGRMPSHRTHTIPWATAHDRRKPCARLQPAKPRQKIASGPRAAEEGEQGGGRLQEPEHETGCSGVRQRARAPACGAR